MQQLPLTFSFDTGAIGVIADADTQRVLATGFAFVKPNWYVTAKHVAFDKDGICRQLLIGPLAGGNVTAKVIFAHPEIDVAVLMLSRPACEHPLFPAHHSMMGPYPLVAMGWSPSKSKAASNLTIHMTKIDKFQTEVRERDSSREETILFSANESEGGHSGGPILGAAGGVVGVIIEHLTSDDGVIARATGILPVVDCLTLA